MKFMRFDKKCFNCLNWHIGLAAVYLVQPFLIYFLADIDLSRPLDVTFLSRGFFGDQLQITVKTLSDLNLGQVLLIIPAIAGLFHLVFGLRPKAYGKVLAQGVDIWRWLIFGLIFGLVLPLTALIMGVTDIAYLILLGASMLGFGWLGLLGEYVKTCIEPVKRRAAKPKQQQVVFAHLLKLVFSLKKIVGLLPWLVVGISLASGGLLAANAYGWQHSLIYLSGLLLMIVWLLNASVHHRDRQNNRPYNDVEAVYFGSGLVLLSVWIWSVALLGA